MRKEITLERAKEMAQTYKDLIKNACDYDLMGCYNSSEPLREEAEEIRKFLEDKGYNITELLKGENYVAML
jgi:cation transport ATPase